MLGSQEAESAPPAGADQVRVETSGVCRVISVVRPESRNALDRATLEALLEALVAAAAEPALRAVVLTGEGDTFLSGGDLRELEGKDAPLDAERLCDLGRMVTRAIADLPLPVIAALPGPAIGGGAEIAVACDLRIAEERARVCFKHGRMAVTTAWGTLPKLSALVGPSYAARILFRAEEVPARDALLAGLVDDVVPDGEARARALSWAMDIAASAPAAVRNQKALLRDVLWNPTAVWAAERARFVDTWTSPDHAEAVRAFLERRDPVWRS
jgi:enoyl-CoA hydratase/carnithine racemase